MRMIIKKEDVKSLVGKFIIEINDEDEAEFELTDKNWDFYKEKRISFICGLTFNGFYYKFGSFDTMEEFVEYFNPHNNRFKRLLTSKELDFVCKKLKEENY